MKNALLYGMGVLMLLGLSCKEVSESDTAETAQQATAVREWKPDDTRSLTGMTAQRGVLLDTEFDTDGYVLFEPSKSTATFLIDKKGLVVHRWEGELNSMNSYLLPNGHLIRLERDEDFPTFAAGGQAGRIREYDWEGNMTWDYELATENELLHHDIEIMPNGNILGISYEVIPYEKALALGRNPEHLPKAGLWLDKVVEIRPTRPKGGEIVWEWHMKDHLVQEFDEKKANYGALAENPRRIDINFQSAEASGSITEEELEQMKKMGGATSNATVDNHGSDIAHTNAISYNAALDQIVLSVPGLCEVLIIDHSTTTEEAKGSTGGRSGLGGDLLYRWGNPANYGKGGKEDQKLFFQHDAKWIPKGYPGEGNLMVFNNDIPNPKSTYDNAWAQFDSVSPPDFAMEVGKVGNFSAVYQWTPPTDRSGAYILGEDGTFGPDQPDWSYTAPDTYSFWSMFISGAHRLPNGHTLITQGMQGRVFEIDAQKDIVWEYWMPYVYDYTLPDGSPAQPGGPFIFGLFRSTLYPADHGAFQGKTIGPLEPQPVPFKLPPPPARPTEEGTE